LLAWRRSARDAGAPGSRISKAEAELQENRSGEDRRSRLIESLKTEAESQNSAGAPPAFGTKGFRYPRSRWSAPAE
jgi:hypothetical protein